MRDGPAIEVRKLRKSYGGHHVLKGLDLEVRRGTMLALLGPNGAGKTTAVRILSTLLDFDSGVVKVAGYDVAGEGRAVRRAIGLTGQQTAVDGLLTGRENLVMMGKLQRLRGGASRRAADLLDQFDLRAAADRQVKTYSGGMRRRLDLAISLLTSPSVLFLDEPTTGLDPRSRTQVWATVRELLSGGVTVLLTTQYLEEADQLADRVAVVDGGRVVADGTPAELKHQVGAERLVLTFGSAEVVAVAADVLAEDNPNREDRMVSVPVAHAKDVRRILGRLADVGIEPDDLTVDKPTLDDVFLTLTGTHVGGQ
ncbi:ABC transporter [Prauserella marina]|uniref:ABC-2 type transport system ATP-binding protein n=1 Tax=Prauserella marina TaxID=530584 RepID=A0A222VPS5_9PSEU|nr:ATP-binding cassette domain-containing protein [Prauserella marina]ASR35926.1 ABC transporter [Prauserella marina]PWV84146.1 ABC-2 type transport system ATP-binding protein [Prauserella marina]SDC29340.1 ABC-2 type transport system ATP-binding protein [Prauserella marina]